MKLPEFSQSILIACLSMLATGHVMADEIRVAVASNFSGAARHLAQRFESGSHHKVILIFGSTGKHYAQIKNGAPFDAFFAADIKRPGLLEAEDLALPDSRFTYAVGKLVLWSPAPDYIDEQGKVLEQGSYRHLAIANPKLAPYGKAAQQVLQARGIWTAMQTRMVRGENIGQAFQFVRSGNAKLGFVAYSQLKATEQPVEGSLWVVPQSLYSPIEQQAVLLKDNNAARAFMSFVKSKAARKIIRKFGYGVP